MTAEPEIMDVITQKIVDFYFNDDGDDDYYDDDDDGNVNDNPTNETSKYVQVKKINIMWLLFLMRMLHVKRKFQGSQTMKTPSKESTKFLHFFIA